MEIKFKGKFITEKDLRKFFQKGGYSPYDGKTVSPEKRLGKIKKLEKETERILKKYIKKENNLELLILKGHLVFEFIINHAIMDLAPVEVNVQKDFYLHDKIKIVYMMGLLPEAGLFVTLDLFNTLRNKVSHEFEFDKSLVDKIIKINNTDLKQKKLSSRQRVSMLRNIILKCVYFIEGHIDAHNLIYYSELSKKKKK